MGRILLLLALTLSCGLADEPGPTLSWESQNSGVKTSIRALSAVDESVCWFGTGRGIIGRTTNGGKTWERFLVKGAEDLEFRDVEAFDAQRCLAMSVGEGSASRVYRTIDGGKSWRLVYQNQAPRGFFDGMAFWDEKKGLLAGDPVGGHLFILRTSDGGASSSGDGLSGRLLLAVQAGELLTRRALNGLLLLTRLAGPADSTLLRPGL